MAAMIVRVELAAALAYWTEDTKLFPLLQIVMLGLAVLAWFRDRAGRRRSGSGSGGASLSVKRGGQSMEVFTRTAAGVYGVLILICVVVSPAHRVLWVLVDTFVALYVCVLNGWSRNNLLSYVDKLRSIETR